MEDNYQIYYIVLRDQEGKYYYELNQSLEDMTEEFADNRNKIEFSSFRMDYLDDARDILNAACAQITEKELYRELKFLEHLK